MAAPAPLFTTAPRLQIVIAGKTLGFAIGMNLNISVNQQPVQILGQFGPVSIEPTAYNVVTGTMQIIRLASTVKLNTVDDYFTSQPGILPPVPALIPVDGSPATELQTAVNETNSNSPASQSGLIRHMDPRTVLLSRTFDLTLSMKVPVAANVGDLLDDDLTNDPSPSEVTANLGTYFEPVNWMTITGCRLTSRNVNLSVGQLVNEPVSFQGLLATTYDSTDKTKQLMQEG